MPVVASRADVGVEIAQAGVEAHERGPGTADLVAKPLLRVDPDDEDVVRLRLGEWFRDNGLRVGLAVRLGGVVVRRGGGFNL